MKQLSMFPTQITSISSQKIPEIQGLRYISEFISKEEEGLLAEIINMQEWNLDLKRRVQHYGYRYNYSNKTISKDDYIAPLPEFLEDIAQKLVSLEI